MIVGLKSAFAMLKRKKIESILIGLTILLTSMLVYIGLSLMNQKAPFEEMYKRANGSENLLFIDSKANDVEDIKNWLKNHEVVKSVNEYHAFDTSVEFIKDNEKVNNMLFITEYVENSQQDIIYINEQEIAKTPEDGEIYISYYFANSNDLKIGDVLDVKFGEVYYEFTIAELVVDPQFNNGFMTPYRSFVSPGFFEENEIEPELSLVGIKYHDYSLENEKILKKDFDAYMIDSIQPSFIKFSLIDAAYNMIGNIIASALLLVSIFMFIIVIFIIRVTIRNQIFNQYKIIGVRKAIGYSSKQIRQMFLFMYMLTGIIASIIGAMLGMPVRRLIEKKLTNNLQVDVSTSIDLYFILTIIIVLALLILFVTLAANKANIVKPIQAIKYGIPEYQIKRSKFRINTFERVPLSIVLAIKQILMDKRKTIISILSILIITFVTLTISNITGSMANGKHFSKYLIGMQVGDKTVTVSNSQSIKDIINKLESIDTVDSVIYNTKELSGSTLSKDGSENIPLFGTLLYGNADDSLLVLTEGRQPLEDNEIVISSPVAKDAGKSIGDYITIKRSTGSDAYLITGIYDSVMHSGYSYVLIDENIEEEILLKNGYYWLYMNEENVIMEDIETNIVDMFGDGVTVEELDRDSLQIVNSIETVPYVSNMILFIFLIVCGIIIFNWTLIDISRSTKVYGIFKATGFSNSQVRIMLIVKSMLLTLMGVVVGYIICALMIDSIMKAMFSITPYSSINLPVDFSHSKSIVIVSLYGIITLIATLIPTRRIAKISPKILISE